LGLPIRALPAQLVSRATSRFREVQVPLELTADLSARLATLSLVALPELHNDQAGADEGTPLDVVDDELPVLFDEEAAEGSGDGGGRRPIWAEGPLADEGTR
jgi:hypothetical protein